MSLLKNQRGMSLMEVIIAMGLMMVGALAMMMMQENNMKGVAGLEFKLKRQELRTMINRQVLTDPNHCKCMFEGLAPFNAPASPPGITLTGANPTQIGRFKFATPGHCAGATIPNPILSTTKEMDDIIATEFKITDVTGFDGVYSGNLMISMKTDKKVTGPSSVSMKIPVSLITESSGGNVVFQGCSSESTSKQPSGFSFEASDGVGQTLSVSDGSRAFSFSHIGNDVKAIMISYVIGSPSTGREDRKCTIAGGSTAITLGNDSKGDGGQRMVAGTAFIPMNQCGSMNLTCSNKGNQGNIKVLAVIKGEPNCPPPSATPSAGSCEPGEFYVQNVGCINPGNLWM